VCGGEDDETKIRLLLPCLIVSTLFSPFYIYSLFYSSHTFNIVVVVVDDVAAATMILRRESEKNISEECRRRRKRGIHVYIFFG
jgi:hypothetical protein